MMKKIFIFLGVIIFILLVISLILSSLLSQKKPKTTQTAPSSQTPSLSPSSASSNVPTAIKNILPYKTADFTIDYSVQQDKYVITKKNPSADNQINNWLKENNLQDKITTTNSIFMNDFTPITPTQATKNLLIEFINSFINNYAINSSPTVNPLPTPLPSQILSPTKKPKNPASTPKPQPSGLVYYPQCSGDYDNYPLPGGCTICQAGCGSTTAAMILASYVDQKYDPENVADLYGKNGYTLGCGGSGYSEPKSLFENMGLKTSDYILADYDGVTVDQVADDFRKYLNAGWTLFTLARFNAGGHYFWITGIDQNDNVLAYDPYYGRLTIPPFNENQYYPNPKYRVVFGVKK